MAGKTDKRILFSNVFGEIYKRYMHVEICHSTAAICMSLIKSWVNAYALNVQIIYKPDYSLTFSIC